MEEILRTRGHDEVARRPCRRDGLPNALNRMFEGVDRLILAAAGILDRSAGETRPDGRFHQAPAFQWLVVESVFQVGGDRDVDGCANRRRDLQDRKSTRLNSVTNAHLVCRLLLETKTTIETS